MTRINTNVPSFVAQNRLNRSNADLQETLTRLSTGLRINSGKDDPAGLIASESLRSEITSITKAISNTNRANQIITTADSALGQVSSLLNDVRGLVVEAANSGALSDDEIAANQLQIDSSLEAINRIAQTTTFQGRKLLDGSLDFVSRSGTNFGNIKSLQIDQANLGASGQVDVTIDIQEAATKASVDINGFSAGATVQAAKSAGSLDFVQAASTGVAATDGSVRFRRNTGDAATLSVTLAGPGAAEFTIDAKTGGEAYNDFTFEFAQDANQTEDIVITDSGNDFVITIKTGSGATLQDVKDAFDAIPEYENFTFTVDTDGAVDDALDVNAAANLATGTDDTLAASSLTVVSDNVGTAGNLGIEIVKSGTAAPSAAIFGDKIRVTLAATGTTTLGDIRDAISAIDGFTATVDEGNAADVIDNTYLSNAAPSVKALKGGKDITTAATGSIAITSKQTGEAFNGTVNIVKSAAATNPTATFANGSLVVTVNDKNPTTLASIASAISGINTGTDFEANVTGTQVNFDGDDSDFTFTTTALSGGADSFTAGVNANAVFELAGKSGSEVFNVSKGTSLAQLVDQINLVKDATGITAAANGTRLELRSSEYGSDSLVDLRVISEDVGGNFGNGARAVGTDIKATINGRQANSKGNEITLNTATLDLKISLEADQTQSSTFSITGGGALFQLGADVVSNQQARIGLQSVSAARLGGVAGKLFELGSGESASLTTDPNKAAKIVTEAIDQVTSLRGRLGAFQATTLESNQISLSDTVANLQEAESSIRDADFAKEAARLTRAQILVQSGTTVLQQANQNPQSVLSLLR